MARRFPDQRTWWERYAPGIMTAVVFVGPFIAGLLVHPAFMLTYMLYLVFAVLNPSTPDEPGGGGAIILLGWLYLAALLLGLGAKYG